MISCFCQNKWEYKKEKKELDALLNIPKKGEVRVSKHYLQTTWRIFMYPSLLNFSVSDSSLRSLIMFLGLAVIKVETQF